MVVGVDVAVVVGLVVAVVVGDVVADVVGVVISQPPKSPWRNETVISLIRPAKVLQVSSAMASTSPKQSMVTSGAVDPGLF